MAPDNRFEGAGDLGGNLSEFRTIARSPFELL